MWGALLSHFILKSPNFLDQCDHWKVIDGKKTWRSKDKRRLYQWDSQHGEIEVYDRHGYHLGSIDRDSGVLIKPAKKGRSIDV